MFKTLLKALKIIKSNQDKTEHLLDDFEDLLKTRSHKYIKREGSPGKYKYTYEEGERQKASVDQLNSLASALHSVRIKAGKEREAVVYEILKNSGDYIKVDREHKIHIGKQTRKAHSVDIYAETEDKIYLFNLKSGGHSNTEPLEDMAHTFLTSRDNLQKTTDKKVEYIILRYDLNKQLKNGNLVQVTNQLKEMGIESKDLNEFTKKDIGVITEKSLQNKFLENIKNKMSEKDLLDTVNFLMGGLKKSVQIAKNNIIKEFIEISAITGMSFKSVTSAFKAAAKQILI